MDVWEALYTTRAMRRLKPEPIPPEVIARIVDAGVRAPSPGSDEPGRFVVVTDRKVMADLGALWQITRAALLEAVPNLYATPAQAASSQYLNDHFADVPLAVFGYGPKAVGAANFVPALWSMCLAARAQGVGSVFTTLFTQCEAQVNDLLGVPVDADVRLIAVIPMGYPKGKWDIAPRRGGHEVSFDNRWGTPPSWQAKIPDFELSGPA
jgi:nitroreductase